MYRTYRSASNLGVQAGFSLPNEVYGAESAFLILINDLYDPVGPPLVYYSTYLCKHPTLALSLALEREDLWYV